MTDVLSQDPASGSMPYGVVEYYDDGSEPLGTVTEIIGGSNSRGIPRQSLLVIDPRSTNDAVPTFGDFGGAARNYIAGIAQGNDPTHPVISSEQYISRHLEQFKAAVSELASDPNIEAIAHHEAAFSLSPVQVLGQVIRSGAGAGVLSDGAVVANAVGLSSGTGVISVEIGALSLTLGAIAQDYASLSGSAFSFTAIQHNVSQALTMFTQGSIHHE